MDPISFLLWRFYYFFRDPPRTAPGGQSIVAPADGRVLYVREIESGTTPNPMKGKVTIPIAEWSGMEWPGMAPTNDGGVLIGIYMTPLSVHYNRAPVAGRVATVVARPAQGENLSMVRVFMRLLWNMRPFEEDSRHILQNARNTIVIDGEVPVVVVQMADRFVSYVDCFVKPGQEVAKGEKIGLIRMGSQCDLFLPRRTALSIQCRPGDRVLAGETVLATY